MKEIWNVWYFYFQLIQKILFELKMMLFEDFGTHTPISTIFYVDFQMIKFLLKE